MLLNPCYLCPNFGDCFECQTCIHKTLHSMGHNIAQGSDVTTYDTQYTDAARLTEQAIIIPRIVEGPLEED